MKQELIELTKEAIQHINDIDDVVDNFTEGIKDLTETASDLIKPIKAFQSVYRLSQKIRFKRFLKSYAKNVKNSFETAQMIDESEKLKVFLMNHRNLNFLYESIDGAINAKSLYCASVLGYFSSLILTKQTDIGYKELIFLNALRSLNDIELETSISIFDSIYDWTDTQNIKNNERLKTNPFIAELVIQKLKYLQVVQEVGWGIGVDNGPGSFRPYDMTEYFYELLKDSGIYDELKSK
jgi:hypothetical protein